ncbi:hypothetical protein Tco_0405414 [Tanacetum coccineum]
MEPASATGENRPSDNKSEFRFQKILSGGEVEWWWHLRRSGGEWMKETILHILCTLDCGFNVTGVFRRDLESDLERVVVVVDWSSLVEDHRNWLSKDVVQVDSFDERSMKSVLGAFLGGFWVEELALEAMRVMIKERILSWLFANFRW